MQTHNAPTITNKQHLTHTYTHTLILYFSDLTHTHTYIHTHTHTHTRSEEHTSELQSHLNLVCRLLLEKTKIFVRTSLFDCFTVTTHDSRVQIVRVSHSKCCEIVDVTAFYVLVLCYICCFFLLECGSPGSPLSLHTGPFLG